MSRNSRAGNRVTRDPRNPTRPSLTEQSPLANPSLNAGPPLTKGTVVGVDGRRHTYLVSTPMGSITMARILSTPGDTALLSEGTSVVVSSLNGRHYISGILPDEVRPDSEESPDRMSGVEGHGGEDSAFDRNYGVNARATGTPIDLLPGDHALRSPDGAIIAAMRGPIAQMKASPLAWIRAFGDTDAIEIIAGLLRVVTWMGESRVINEGGKTSFIWRGGSDQTSQTGMGTERYPIRLDVGHTGDLIKLEVTTPEGQSLFRFHVDSQGHLEIFAAGGIDQTGGGTDVHQVRHDGTRDTTITGDDTHRVDGAVTQQFGATLNTEVSGNDSRAVGGNQTQFVNNDLDVSAGGKLTMSGHDSVKLGSQGDIEIKTLTGKLHGFSSDVRLGPAPVSHATKYEELARALDQFKNDYNQFKIRVATHVHTPPTGPAPTLASSGVPCSAVWTLAKADSVKVG